jgi:2-C-methyl-D-erythritol 4-phosphate cytidylyltransferase
MDGCVVAIVPAAGLGERFGPGANKPFVKLLGKPLVAWALEALQAMDAVTEIVPVFKEADMDEGAAMVEAFGLSKLKRIAPGGVERQDSVMNGLRLVGDASCTVLIHDGGRPLVRPSLITDTLNGLRGYDGAVVAVPPKDTIKEAGGDGVVRGTLRREALWAVQTPQVFSFGTIMEAHLAAQKEGYYSTDDSALVERRGGRVNIVMGSYDNIKITTPEDLHIAEMLMGRRQAV